MNDTHAYLQSYSPTRFWAKVGGVAKQAGYEVMEKGLWLYYAAAKPEVPVKARATIYGALGYLILPTDILPDIVPVGGYGDDLTVLLGAVAVVSMYIDATVKAMASAKLRDWFGPA